MNLRNKKFLGIIFTLTIFVVSGVYLIISGWENPFAIRRSPFGKTRLALEAEERLLELTPYLARLSTSIKNLEFPSFTGKELFASEVFFNDLLSDVSKLDDNRLPSLASSFRHWKLQQEPTRSSLEKVTMWEPWIRQVEYFDYAKFYFVKSEFPDSSRDVWSAEIGFQALARTNRGTWQWVKASMETKWTRNTGEKNESMPYLISEWDLKKFTTLEAEKPMFEESLGRTIRDPELLARLRRCLHEEYSIQKFRQGDDFEPPHEQFFHVAWDRHPSVTVVDLDRDGFDDLYILCRWERNIFLRNRGDGTFEEKSKEYGLDIEGYSSTAIFADFDNDGDSDLILGRTLKRSMYLENQNGIFVDRSDDAIDSHLPPMVASISAADYNGDGLLDIYFSTYLSSNTNSFEPDMLSALQELWDRDIFSTLLGGSGRDLNPYKNALGPPNILLVNKGNGNFELSPESKNLELWRDSYQATWGDYDNDGDPDLYVANDFAPNNLFRNDDGKFVDVTEETGTADIGFGMGASWGDYNNDNHQDLYVTNMFSKAGLRLTSAIPGTDPEFAFMARGNSLLKNTGNGRFEHVSGLSRPALTVEAAGWSWCGQFTDFNNDGFLDIYALSGFYTSPKQIAIPGEDL